MVMHTSVTDLMGLNIKQFYQIYRAAAHVLEKWKG